LIIEINKDIEKYQESVAMGLSAKQLVYSILGIIVVAFIGGVGYMVYKQKENTETK
jgi:nitrate reductase NapE component